MAENPDALTPEDYAALIEVKKGQMSSLGAGASEEKLTKLELITKIRFENVLTDKGKMALEAWQRP